MIDKEQEAKIRGASIVAGALAKVLHEIERIPPRKKVLRHALIEEAQLYAADLSQQLEGLELATRIF